MGKVVYSRRNNSPWLADLTQWNRDHAEDNSERLGRLRRNLEVIRKRELTARQRQVVEMYYEKGMKIPEIARRLEVKPCTVSRTLRRARERIYKYLRYTL